MQKGNQTSKPYDRDESQILEIEGRSRRLTLCITEMKGGTIKVNRDEAKRAGILEIYLQDTNQLAYNKDLNPGGRSCFAHPVWADAFISKERVDQLGGRHNIKTRLDKARHKKYGKPFAE